MNSLDLGENLSQKKIRPSHGPMDEERGRLSSLSTKNGFSNVDFQFTFLGKLNMPFFGGGGVGVGLWEGWFFGQSPFAYNTP